MKLEEQIKKIKSDITTFARERNLEVEINQADPIDKLMDNFLEEIGNYLITAGLIEAAYSANIPYEESGEFIIFSENYVEKNLKEDGDEISDEQLVEIYLDSKK